MSEDVVSLSMQQHGCRVVQAIIQTASAAGMDVSLAINGVIAGGLEQLSLHKFANYAVQVPEPAPALLYVPDALFLV
jgi:pumilio RNA-binding family